MAIPLTVQQRDLLDIRTDLDVVSDMVRRSYG